MDSPVIHSVEDSFSGISGEDWHKNDFVTLKNFLPKCHKNFAFEGEGGLSEGKVSQPVVGF